MPVVNVRDNTPLKYIIQGNGPTIICVLGYGMTLDEWPNRMISRLAQSFRVILYNHRGISGEVNPEVSFTIPQGAEDLHDVISTLADGPVHIMGYSMGGMIGMECAIRYPALVNHLILLSTHCGEIEMVPPETWVIDEMGQEISNLEGYLDRAGRLLLTDTFRKNHPDPRSWFVDFGEAANPDIVREQYQALASWEGVFSQLNQISSSTLVIAGEQDIVVPIENARIIAGVIPTATLHIMKEAGHGLIFEVPLEIANIIGTYLKEV